MLLRKKAVLDTTILIHCKARQFLRDQFSTNQEKSLERALERADNNLKAPVIYSDGRFETLANSGRSLI